MRLLLDGVVNALLIPVLFFYIWWPWLLAAGLAYWFLWRPVSRFMRGYAP